MQKRLKDLFDNYIVGFPKENAAEPKYISNVWGDKIITDYKNIGGDFSNTVIEITDDVITNQLEIKKIENGLRTVYVGVIKQKNNNTPELIIKQLYGELAIKN